MSHPGKLGKSASYIGEKVELYQLQSALQNMKEIYLRLKVGIMRINYQKAKVL